jgi:hypothetical protein
MLRRDRVPGRPVRFRQVRFTDPDQPAAAILADARFVALATAPDLAAGDTSIGFGKAGTVRPVTVDPQPTGRRRW